MTVAVPPVRSTWTTHDLNRVADAVVELQSVVNGAAPIFNVKDPAFGGKGDGLTNDAPAIQAAITAAAVNGGIVYFPDGTYILTAVVNVPSNVTLRGAGMGRTTLKAGASTQLVNINAGVSNVAFEDMTLNGNRAGFGAGTDAVIGGGGNVTDLRMSNIRVTNSRAFSVFLNTGSGGWTRGRITDCIFEDSGAGFDTFGSGQLTDFIFHGCLWRNTTGQGFATTNSFGGIIFSGCHFEGPMGNGISLEPGGNVLIVGCHFHNLNSGAIAIRAVPVASLAADPYGITIVGCRIYNIGAVAGNLTTYGILLRNTSDSLVTGCTITRMGLVGVLLDAVSIALSGNSCKNVVVSGNVIQDSNQNNSASTPNVLLQQSAGSISDVTVVGNQLGKPNGDSNATHAILETGTVTRGMYAHNNMQGVLTAGVGFGAGTTNRAFGNYGFNPVGHAVAQPAVPASTVAQTNTTGVDCTVFVSGGTVTAVAIGGSSTGMTSGSFRVPAGQTITLTYSVAPTWQWFGD